MADLPTDILSTIFFKLPLESLFRCKCVCKSWRQLVCDPDFVRNHLNQSHQHSLKLLTRSFPNCFHSIDYKSRPHGVLQHEFPLKTRRVAKILGSLNGLICIALNLEKDNLSEEYNLLFWNPSTGNYKMLPDPNPCIGQGQLLGFGYDSYDDDYKIVRVIIHGEHSQVVMYMRKTNSWKFVTDGPPHHGGQILFLPNKLGTAVNGSIYWTIYHYFGGQQPNLGMILGFNLKDEKFRELTWHRPKEASTPNLTVIEGCLGMTCMMRQGREVALWIMKEGEWNNLINISCSSWGIYENFIPTRTVCYWENEKVFLYNVEAVYESYPKENAEGKLYRELPQIGSIVRVSSVRGIIGCSGTQDWVTYTESLVSPDA
ncbi:hypothetical protein LguiA_031105 [Lonicera macranthoides]